MGVIGRKSLHVKKSLNARKGIEDQNNDISLMKPKTLLKILLTMIPLMMMTKPNQNSDFLACTELLTFRDFLSKNPKCASDYLFCINTSFKKIVRQNDLFCFYLICPE